ncbi:MAG: hypothetical protein WBV85_07340 [Solirubrobacteraceae bacterium]
MAHAHRKKIPIAIAIDGEAIRSETLATHVGAYVVVIETTLADLAIDLHSIYIGNPKVKTQATHLTLTKTTREARTAEHEHDAIPVMYAKRRCLYDHLQQLQDLLQADGAQAHIPVHEKAIEAIER